MKWPFSKPREADLPPTDDPQWERALINRMAAEFLRDQRRGRLWGNVFKLGLLGYLLLLAGIFAFQGLSDSLGAAGDHTALVEIDGVIAPESEASADRIITALRKAFEADKAKGIVLRINSPGGSPVQSGYVYDEIKRLKKLHPDKPVYAVAVDVCASGAYYIASAADEIYVNPATLIGSIGVRLDSFGFDKTIEALGVQRRLLTAGEHKGILDPFSPLDPTDRAFLQGLLDQLHQQFIAAVKAGRGDRLTGGEEVFSGLFWTGEQSIGLGLSDGIGSSSSVARDLIKAEEIVEYTQKRDLIERLSERFSASLAGSLAQLAGLAGTPQLR